MEEKRRFLILGFSNDLRILKELREMIKIIKGFRGIFKGKKKQRTRIR